MLKDYFHSKRESMFPEVKDFETWENPYKTINPQEITYKQWLWCHPSAFNLLRYGGNVLGLVIFGSISVHYTLNKSPIAILTGLVTLSLIIGLRGMIKNHQYTKDMTLFDLFMR